jgi:polyisoprenoid-binding protein YceI
MSGSATDIQPDVLRGTWAIDPAHSSFEFQARHAMIAKVKGRFSEFTGTLTLNPESPTASSADITIQAASLDTRQPDRDAHLKSADFLETDKYETIEFKSSRIEDEGDNDFKVYGELTIRDVTKEVALDLTFTGLAVDPFGNQRAGFEAETTVNRKDWGLTWNAPLEAGGVLVGDKVKLAIDISAIKQS